MVTITEDFVSLEIAKLLKEKGFDWECEYFYDYYKENDKYVVCSTGGSCNKEDYPSEYSMPTLQMAMKWLREVHNIFITIEIKGDPRKEDFIYYKWSVAKYCNIKIDRIDNNLTCPEDYWIALYEEEETYERTCEAAIKYCLEHLI